MTSLAKHPLQVAWLQRLMAFAARLAAFPARITPPPFRLLQLGSAYWQSRAVYLAAKLGVAERIGGAEMAVAELAASLGVDEDPLYRLLRMLASLGVFEETAPRVFGNSAVSEYLRADHPHSLRPMVLMHNSPEMTAAWHSGLEVAVRDGGVPFAAANGAELFEYMDGHRDFDLLFAQAMDAVEGLTGSAYLEDFDWRPFARLIDVGGSTGSKALAVLARHRHLSALVVDRPQVVAAARQGTLPADLAGRIEFLAGDMFEALPAACSERDLYLFFAIFHGLSDAQGRQVLDTLRAACGRLRPYVLIGDAVMPDRGADAALTAFDMQMLVGTRGRERTLGEWRSLLEGGGFELLEVIAARTFAKFLVARPR